MQILNAYLSQEFLTTPIQVLTGLTPHEYKGISQLI